MAQQAHHEHTRSNDRLPDRSDDEVQGRPRRAHATGIAYVTGIVTSGVFALFTAKLIVQASAVPPAFRIVTWVAIPAAIVMTLLFLTATASARTGRPTGRILLLVASSLAIAFTVSFTTYTYFHGPTVYGAEAPAMAALQLLLGVTLPLITLLAAALTRPPHADT